jgi:deoxyribodipyrimidine photo-lyase
MILVWHRGDLRIHDHLALFEASARGAVLPCFVLDPNLLRMPYTGNNRIAWLYACLRALQDQYTKLGSSLVLRAGPPEEELIRLAQESGAKAVYALRSYEPVGRARDERVGRALEQAGIEFRVFNGDCILEPGLLKTGSGTSFKVFTPFWRVWSQNAMPIPLEAPPHLESHGVRSSVEISDAPSSLPLPHAGEGAALKRLESFIGRVGLKYEAERNTPSIPGTSHLSIDLHLGVLSPRVAAARAAQSGMTGWVRELAWRDFYRHILWDEPRLETEPFKPAWKTFPWRDTDGEAKADLEAWRTGNTGYPVVDAGMRQMIQTGWMHNRLRMIVASFLCKHLLISWKTGVDVFHEHLLDGDLASNNGGWQWCAGCGVDAAPYFRVFNPVTQGEKFDADAKYIKQYVPELEGLPTKEAHQPWTSLRPPKDYPAPIIPLSLGRDRFLETAKGHLKTEQAQ